MSVSQQTILIIDDHRLFADGLTVLLQQMDDKLTVTTEYNAQFALTDPERLTTYDLLLIDVNMPNLNGFDFLRSLHKRGINTKVLFVSASEEIPDIEQAMRLGARGYIPKSLPSREMIAGIQQVLSGEIYLPHYWRDSVDWSVCNPKLNAPSKKKLSVAGLRPRQIEVLELMHQGHTNRRIASILGISESAVKSHISILFKALNTKNRTAAIKAGLELGLI